MFRTLADLATRRPRIVMLVAAVVAVVAMTYGTRVTAGLDTWGFDDPGSEYYQALLQYNAATGIDPAGQVVALIQTKGPVTGPEGRRLATLSTRLLRSEPAMHDIVNPLASPRPPPGLISRDGHAALVYGFLRHKDVNGPAGNTLLKLFAPLHKDGVTLGSGAITRKVVSDTVQEDLHRAELIAFPLLFLFALLVFRGVIAASIPLLVGMIAIPFSFSLLRLLANFSTLSIFALNLITGLGVGLAIDYSLLIITRFREELARGADPRRAIVTTVSTAGRTVLFSSLTVAGAIASLLVFPQPYLYSMAIGGVTVAITSAVVALLILPSALVLLGHRINAWSFGRADDSGARRNWLRLSRWVMGRPVLVAAGTLIVLLILATPLLGLRLTSTDGRVLPPGYGTRMVEQKIQSEFAHGQLASTAFAVIAAPRRAEPRVDAYARRIADDPSVKRVDPPRYVGNQTWRVDVFPRGATFTHAAQNAIKHMRAVTGGLDVRVSGLSAWFVDQRASIVSHVPALLLIIAAVTFLALFAMTGSVVLPIKTFLLNLCTLAATFGILIWIFQNGHFESLLGYHSPGALEITQPVILFAVAFGLTTDYAVFLLSRIKELHDGGANNFDAVTHGVARTGGIITAAALLFCIAMIAFATSRIAFVKATGVGTALAVAIDATLVRALLVPSLMALLGNYNWWAPRPLKLLHRRFGWHEREAHPDPDAQL